MGNIMEDFIYMFNICVAYLHIICFLREFTHVRPPFNNLTVEHLKRLQQP